MKHSLGFCVILFVSSCLLPNSNARRERIFIDSLMKTKKYDTITTFLSEYRSNSLADKVNNTGNSLINHGLVSDYYFILHLRDGASINTKVLEEESIEIANSIFDKILGADKSKYRNLYLIYTSEDSAYIYPFIK
jgi:hypothetical protein